jgi:hypothetical protein
MKSTVTIYVPEGEDPFGTYLTRKPREKVNRFAEYLRAIAGSGILGRAQSRPSITAGATYGNALVTLAAVAAADTVTINGVVFTAVAGAAGANQFSVDGTDIVDASGFVTSVNASVTPLVSGYVKADNRSGTVTLAGVTAGQTVTIGGVTFTAVGGPATSTTTFDISGSDTTDAFSLVAKVNAHPFLREQVVASSAAGLVTVRQLPFGPTQTLGLSKSGAGITVSGTTLAAAASVLLCAVEKGQTGNVHTLASSNGTRLLVSGARFSGGSSTVFTF